MVLIKLGSAIKNTIPKIFRRNYGMTYVLCSKSSDPVQQLFLDKIHEFSSKINDKNFIKQFPELQKDLDEELMRITRQYGGDNPEDLVKFPDYKAQQPTIDPQEGF